MEHGVEADRLEQARTGIPWKRWGPYLSERQWGTVREDYSDNGDAWNYEWNFSDVNPPVHAWATLAVYEVELEQRGEGDVAWLKNAFQKLLVNFTWWINRKDPTGRGVFEGGFLGLDNIGVFDRSAPLPTGGQLEQSDGTAWMAFSSQ